MPSDYKKICQDNIRRRGEEFDDMGRLISEQLYGDKSHFIYELLQNAEDALDRRVRNNRGDNPSYKVQFVLFQDRLEFRHFGELFNEEDVRGISDVLMGTKKEDFAQIGTFGIGFKSVYAFTASPEIHSGDEHFAIKRYIRPEAKEPRPGLSIRPDETVFIFPFDHTELSEEEAFDLILEKLRRLGPSVMLFLRRIDEIEWRVEPAQEEGQYLKEVEQVDNYKTAHRVTVIGQNNGQDESEDWLIFEKPVTVPDNSGQVAVEIGFRLENSTEDGTESIRRIHSAPLVVYFPTEKATGLGFLIQGPYRTTPARDNVPEHDAWNRELSRQTAELVVESLRQLKEMGLSSVSLLRALPIGMDDFPETSLFYPIFSKVRKALMDEELLPADDGTFVAARNAKIAGSERLNKLLNSNQLRQLLQTTGVTKWLSSEISERRTLALWRYLRSELEVVEVDPEMFARRLNEQFLACQSDEWFIEFYKFLSGQEALWRPPRYWRTGGILRNKPILRLQGGTHVIPFQDDGSPNAYLADKTDIDTSLPIVKLALSENEGARHFLSQLGIPELDLVAEVIEKILPKYLDDRFTVSSEENRRDLKKIERAYETDSQEKKRRLRKQLLEIPFILAERPHSGKTVYRRPFQVYFGNEELHMYFSGNDSFACVNSSHPQSELLRNLGVRDAVRIKRREGNWEKHVTIRDQHSWHERGLNGFDPNIKIDGLKFAISTPTPQKSAFIWNTITIPNSDCIRGVVEKSSRKTYEGSRREDEVSEFGELLINTAWLPGPDGNIYKPSELTLDDLPESFVRDEELADCLGMKKDIVAQLAEESGISEESLEFARQIDKAPPDVQEKIASLLQKGQENQAEFPQRSTTNPERRQERLKEHMRNASDKEYETRPRSVRTSRGSIDPSIWLRNLYTNDSDQMLCQICKEEMPFRKRNGEHYFEAVEALSLEYFGKEQDAQFLALCPLCAAKYKEFVKRDEEQEETLYHALQNAEGLEVPVKLEERETSVRFEERHWLDMKTILRVYQE
ncbi:MAG: hypothetical protein OXG25_01215 [Gammaproteobacteria bacterium]|nr:hypothetical protein [Gammaproteobacteria bacterium]